MRRKRSGFNSTMDGLPAILSCLLFCMAAINPTNAARRFDLPHRINRALMPASPSVETLKELAVAMGAAGFEQFAEGASKPIVKRLIPENVDPDLEGEDYQGVIGKPGVDFPVLTGIPTTSFDCRTVSTGYYADLETDCQVFHICDTGRKISFLCPNGTIFRQSHLICDWWFKVDCSSSTQSAEDSSEQYSGEQLKKIALNPHPLSNHKNSDIQTINADASNIAIKAELNGKVLTTNKENIPVKPVSKFSFSSIEEQKPYTERAVRQRTTKTNSEISKQSNNNGRTSSRSFHVLLPQDNFKVPAEFPSITETINEKRRRNLIKQISSRIQATKNISSENYTNVHTYRSTPPSYENNPRESQVLAETAAFASNSNSRNFLQLNYNNFNNNLKLHSSTSTTRSGRVKSANSAVTSSYVPDVRSRSEFLRNTRTSSTPSSETTQKSTLIPYATHSTTKATVLGELPGEKHQPYTRPGVWLLKGHLDQLRNETALNESSMAINETKTTASNAKTDEVTTITPVTTTKLDSNNNDTDTASTINFSIRHSDGFNSFNHISTEPTFFERRDRVGKKLQILDPTAPEEINKKFYGTRPGLIVPPSLTPHTLHSLAIYYATAMDNLYTTTENDELETTTIPTDLDENQEYLTSLLTRNTIDNYSNLFKEEAKVQVQDTNTETNSTETDISTGDLSMSQSQGPLASSPQIRELAQVFTHALSAYLQDPEQFRKVLSEIRPTHPTFADIVTTPSSFTGDYTADEGLYTREDEDEEILGFSDDNKAGKKTLSQLRELGLSPPTAFPSISTRFTDTNVRSATLNGDQDTPSLIHRGAYPPCCSASISASYTSAPTPSTVSQNTAHIQFTSPSSSLEGINTRNNVNEHSNSPVDSTESSYSLPRYGGFQNNSDTDMNSPYGKDVKPANAKPLTIENYIRSNDIPTSWGETVTSENSYPSTVSVPYDGNSNKNTLEVGNLVKFDSVTTINEEYTTPAPNYSSTISSVPKQTFEYVTPTQNHNYTLEMENEEELQSAHSQSFLTPQNSYNDNNDKDGEKATDKTNGPKLVTNEVKFHSTTPSYTTLHPVQSLEYTSTLKPIYVEETGSTVSPVTSDSSFTSNDATRDNTGTYPWSTNYDNWHSTVILDPITLNEGLSVDIQSASTNPRFGDTQTTFWDQTPSTVFIPSTTPIPEYTKYEHITTALNESPSAKPDDVFTLSNRNADFTASTEHSTTNSREGKSLTNTVETTEVTTEVNTVNIEEQMMEKAKEVLGELNVTSTDSLVKAMKKTKSNTMRRLILLLVQTCDDDHNKTAEASKRALLQALKSLSNTDNLHIDEDNQTELPISFSETLSADVLSSFHADNVNRRMDTIPSENSSDENANSRQGKNLRLQLNLQNGLIDSAAENVKTTTNTNPLTGNDLTTTNPLAYDTDESGGGEVHKFLARSSLVDIKSTTTPEPPKAEAQVLVDTDKDSKSDTRAIELLRSLYTIAAKWG